MSRFFRSALFPLLIIILLVYLASQTLLPRSEETTQLTYSELIRTVEESGSTAVSNVVFVPKSQQIQAVVRG